jgi:hypothetical protein
VSRKDELGSQEQISTFDYLSNKETVAKYWMIIRYDNSDRMMPFSIHKPACRLCGMVISNREPRPGIESSLS